MKKRSKIPKKQRQLYVLLDECREALFWMGGFDAFQENSPSREGYEVIVRPVLDKIHKELGGRTWKS